MRANRTSPRRLRRTPFLIVVAVAMLLLGACTPEQQMAHDNVNANRANVGAPAMWPHPDLITKAQAWAESLAARGALEHSNLAEGVPPGWQMLGENVGRGPSEQAVLDQFLASPHHRDNVLNPDFTHLGTGIATAADGTVYVVEVFARY
ncbi:MAG TPA: CAP domain-containing protein [Acidimicrobiales bacterium]|jgi:uncharacterized protein YkwD|nr:CAP domain-containing protein [Acidimicrobiales bacterium]